MKTSRRTFLKLAGSTGAGLMFPLSLSAAEESKRFPLHKPIGEARTICPYCSVGVNNGLEFSKIAGLEFTR